MALSEILDHAKAALLAQGEHPPMLIAEGSTQRAVFLLAQFGRSAPDNRSILFQTGFQGAKVADLSDLVTVYLISETWLSQQHGIRPRDDPRRIEALMIASLEVATGKQIAHVYEMLRDGSGQLADLRLFAAQEAQGALLQAFVDGFLLAQRGKSGLN